MAIGDSKIHSQYDLKAYEGDYDNSNDVFKYVIITEGFSSIDEDATAIGIANFTKVASSGNYVQDTTLANTSWTRTGGVSTLTFDSFSFAADGANPTTGKTIAIYNDTSANKDVLKLVDMTVDGGTTAADTTLGLTYTVNGSGSVRVTSNV